MSKIWCLVCIGFLLGILLPAVAYAESTHADLLLGISVQDFGYKEFSDQNTLFDREDGWISGISGSFSQQTDKYFLDVGFTYLKGDVVYDGQTQSGLPHKTQTNEQIIDTTISLGILDAINLARPSSLYFGFGFREWQRNILSTNNVRGLFETYSWYYGFVGGKVELLSKDKLSVWLDGRLTRPINPTMEVCYSNFDCADLSLGVNTSGRVSLPIHYRINTNSKLVVEPYFESWDFGRSPNQTLTINGAPAGGFIYEPRSETRNGGISISVSSQF